MVHTCVSKKVTLLEFPVFLEPSFLSLPLFLRFKSLTNFPAVVLVFFGASFDSILLCLVYFVCFRGEHLT